MNKCDKYFKPMNSVHANGSCGKDLNWRIADNILRISGKGAMTNYISPWYAYKGFIERIVIDEGVTSIGDYAFYNCFPLKEIIIPKSMERIGDLAFYSCDLLKEIIMPESIESIGNDSFKDCSQLNIICKKGSYTDAFASEKNFRVIYK